MEIRKTAGFTIVELVVVIVVIGILAAVALPRFLGLQDRAHDAVVEGTQSALASGVVMANSIWLAEGRDSAMDNILEKKDLVNSCVGGTTAADGSAVCPPITAENPGTNTTIPVSLDANRKGFPVGHSQYNPDGTTSVTNEAVDSKACTEVFEFLLSESSVRATDTPAGTDIAAAFGNVGAAADSAFEFLARNNGTTKCDYLYLPDIADNKGASTPRTITYDITNGRVSVSNLSSAGTTSN